MIITTISRTQGQFAVLNDSSYMFYLTGSRFFGTANNNSDWDFFVQDSPMLRVFLVKNGFKLDIHTGYDSCLDAAVYQYKDIHIQCVTDVELKIDVQSCIMNLNFYKKWIRDSWNNDHMVPKNKEEMRETWQIASHAMRYMKQKMKKNE